MKKPFAIVFLVVFIALASCESKEHCPCNSCGDCKPVAYTGWAIGWYVDDNKDPTGAAIVSTKDSGHTWVAQGDTTQWTGHVGNDISAVDEKTAWAAVGENDLSDGMILHTADGGQTWVSQTIPAQVQDSMKGIKGLSRTEAWAVSLKGTVLHTTDGGQNWNIVPTPNITMGEINRIDAIGQNIWLVDHMAGASGIIHSRDGGQTWRKETLPDVQPHSGPLAISAFSTSVVWSAANLEMDFFRTVDGGNSWQKVVSLPGMNDFDDICAGSRDWLWAVLNQGGFLGGTIYRVKVTDQSPVIQQFDPAYLNYQYEGVACFDEHNAWVVGYASMHAIPELPQGVIVHTDDGHNWENQVMPADNIRLWKVSFVGAKR